jgi:hypothetical protein
VGILIKIFGHLRKELVQPTLPEKSPLVKLLMDVSESQESILEDHLPLFDKIREICSPSLSMILGMLDQ